MNNTAQNSQYTNTAQTRLPSCPRCRNRLPSVGLAQCPFCGVPFTTQNAGDQNAEARAEAERRAQIEAQRRRAALEAEKNAVYDAAVEILQKRFAKTEDYQKAREMFISVSDFFDVSEPVKYCDRKIIEQKNTLIYYDAGGKMLAARDMFKDADRMRYLVKIQEAIGLLQEAKKIYESIRNFQDSSVKIKECDERIREYSAAIERINNENAEKERQKQKLKMQKRIRIIIAIIVGVAVFGGWMYMKITHPMGF